jgi:hypothetical protein
MLSAISSSLSALPAALAELEDEWLELSSELEST